MKARPFPLESGHPANHGYAKCRLCGVWRPRSKLNNHGGWFACPDSCEPSTKPSHFDPPKPAELVFVAHAGSPEVLP